MSVEFNLMLGYFSPQVDLLQTKLEELQKENSKLKRQNTEVSLQGNLDKFHHFLLGKVMNEGFNLLENE